MPAAFSLFSRFGVELEYMIVDSRTLSIRPLAPELIHQGGARKNERVHKGLRWSNELVSHVIELKTDGPVSTLTGLTERFQHGIAEVENSLSPHAARLMPGGMHPWMDPLRETHLWPHGDREIYECFDAIFNCRGHGWSNLQSTHLNLSFCGELEFRRLHSALRLILPLVPALAAASPCCDGQLSNLLDTRIEVYRNNCAKIPSITGELVPDCALSPHSYQRDVLSPIANDLAPHDPTRVLEAEWVNARGIIPRFERAAIELRLMDNQECPAADIALLQFLIAILRQLVDAHHSTLEQQETPATTHLSQLLLESLRLGGDTRLQHPELAQAFGIPPSQVETISDLLWIWYERSEAAMQDWGPWVSRILHQGNLAQRLIQALGPRPQGETMKAVYLRLADCLRHGKPFLAE